MYLVKYLDDTNKDEEIIANFKLREFACNDGSNIVIVHRTLLTFLSVVRKAYDSPITITSGYRTVFYNKEIGGHEKSHHLVGAAVDLLVPTKALGCQLVHLCNTIFPFTKVGTNYIHCSIWVR